MGGAPVRIKCEVEISAILNYAIVHQLAFFAFVCIAQLFLALRYLFSATSQSIINTTSHFIFSKNVFVCYFCPCLSTKLFLHNYNVMTGSKM